ncbi:MAG: hypothetical protein CMI36_02580 [Owenweeksia sp.]|nr:hypothetical protein [Owenweeksia sp.]
MLRSANFITPSEMVKLMVSTMANTKMQSIYDPACGSGDLLMTAGKELKAQNFFGETQSEMNLRMARLFGLIYKSQQPSAKVNFSDRPFDNKSYDAIISNPPFGLTIKDFSPIGKFNSEFKSGKSEVLFLNHILDSMSENGVASVILPLNALFGKGLMEKVRRRIIDDNLLEAVIQLPSKVFYNSNVSTVIFLLKKQKETEDILLIDLSKDFRKGKKRYEVKSEAIEKAIIAVQSFRNGNKEEKAMVVSPKMVIEKDYNLSLNLYQNSNSKDLPKFRSSEDLLEECKAIERRIGELQKRF